MLVIQPFQFKSANIVASLIISLLQEIERGNRAMSNSQVLATTAARHHAAALRSKEHVLDDGKDRPHKSRVRR